jgi:hypothetical protein
MGSGQLARVATAVLAAFSAVHCASLFLEALAAEREEHAGDDDLARLCSEGHASASLRMRTACIQLRKARATPLLLKAALRAAETAYGQFNSALFSPRSLFAIVLFVLMCVATPLARVLNLMAPAVARAIDDEEQETTRIVVLNGRDFDANDASRPRRLWKRLRHGLARGPHTLREPCYVQEEEGWKAIDLQGPSSFDVGATGPNTRLKFE